MLLLLQDFRVYHLACAITEGQSAASVYFE